MKQILRLDIFGVDIYIIQVKSSDSELLELCAETGMEKQKIQNIKAASRRKEKAATLLILAKMLNTAVEICHKESGAPYLKGRNEHISISHSGDFVAVAVGSEAGIGIDIEIKKDRILKVRERVFSPAELATMPENDINANLAGWTSKEALFKAIPESDINFREHLHLQIPEITTKDEIIRHTASESVSPRHDSYDMTTIINDNFVFTIAKQNKSI